MKTTLDLPDELMREVKIRAVQENRKLKDLIADLLTVGLRQSQQLAEPARHRVTLPLVRVARPAAPGEELTPERMKELLLEEEVDRVFGR